MPLTDTTIRCAKPADKPRRLFDGAGFIWKSPRAGVSGGASNTDLGARKRLSLGVYPDPGISLKAVRVPEGEQAGVQARYGLRPSEYTAWKAVPGH